MAQLAIVAAVMVSSYAIDYFATTRAKVEPIDRGRNNDVRIMGSDHGAMIPIILGKARVAPQIVWHAPIRPVVTTTPGRGGGKGRPKPPEPSVNNYQYFTSLLLEVCAGPLGAGIRKIWANADLVYNLDGAEGVFGHHEAEADDNTLASGAAVESNVDCSGGRGVRLPTSSASLKFNDVEGFGSLTEFGFGYSTSSTGTVDLYVNNVFNRTVSLANQSGGLGWYTTSTLDLPAASDNRLELRNASVSLLIDRIQVDEEVITLNPDPVPAITGVSGGIGGMVRRAIYNAQNAFPTTSGTGLASAQVSNLNARIRTYTGAANQEIDGLLATTLGASAQAYRNRACVMLEELELPGGQVQQFTIEVDEGTRYVSDALVKLFALVDIPSSQLDVSALTTTRFRGLVINQRQEVRAAIEALQIAYNFDFVEQDGKLKAVVRGAAAAIDIQQSDLRVVEGRDGRRPAGPVQITRLEEKSLPRTVAVQYLDPKLDFKNNAQQASRHSGKTEDNETVTLPLVLAADEARAVATRLLYIRHLERTQFEWTTTWKWLHLVPTDIVRLILRNGTTHTIRITEVQAGTPGLVKFKGVKHEQSLYTTTKTVIRSGQGLPVIEPPANSFFQFFDVPPLRPEDNLLGRYIATVAQGPGRWQGATLYEETVEDTFERATEFTTQATMGVCSSALSSSGDPSRWDYTSELYVNLYNGELESITEAEANSHALNLCIYGHEVIQFLIATPLTPPDGFAARYKLTGIRRGMFGTDYLLGRAATQVGRWSGKVGVSESTDAKITKTTATGAWDAGAYIGETWTREEEVIVEWTIPDTTHTRMIGVSRADEADDQGINSLHYAFELVAGGTYNIRERGNLLASALTHTAGDKFAIRFDKGGQVNYFKNGLSSGFSTNHAPPRVPYRADTSIYTNGGVIPAPKISRPSTSDLRPRLEAAWKNFVGCRPRASGGLEQDATKSPSWTSGASSVETLPNGQDGHAEWLAGGGYAMVALTRADETRSGYSTLDYAFYTDPSFNLFAYENGTPTSLGTYTPGVTRLKIAVEGSGTLVRYYVDDVVKRNAPVSPLTIASGLRIDVALADTGTPASYVNTVSFQTEGHYVGETFVLLNSALKFKKEDPEMLYREQRYRMVTVGQDPANVAAASHRLRGNSIRPLAVSGFTARRRDAAWDTVFEWERREAGPTFKDRQKGRQKEDAESYLLEFFDTAHTLKASHIVKLGDTQPAVWSTQPQFRGVGALNGAFVSNSDGGATALYDITTNNNTLYSENRMRGEFSFEFTYEGTSDAGGFVSINNGSLGILFSFVGTALTIAATSTASAGLTVASGDVITVETEGDGVFSVYINRARGTRRAASYQVSFADFVVDSMWSASFGGFWHGNPAGGDGIEISSAYFTTPRPQFVYTLSRMTIDGTPTSSYIARVSRLSPVVGRGFERELLV